MSQPLRLAVPVLLVLLAACTTPVKPTPEPDPPRAAAIPLPAAPPIGAGSSSLAVDASGTPALDDARREAFIAEAAQASGMAPEEVRGWLSQARYQQSIINAITRPAEGAGNDDPAGRFCSLTTGAPPPPPPKPLDSAANGSFVPAAGLTRI